MNLFTQIGGFIFGVASSIVFLPYVTFNHWHKRARLALIIIFTIVLVIMYAVLIFFFHMYQPVRSEEHTSELQSRETISYAIFCLKKKRIL